MSDCPQPCMCPTCYAPYMDEPVTLEDKLTPPDPAVIREAALREAAAIAQGYHDRAIEWAKTVRGLEQYIGETDSSRIAIAILALIQKGAADDRVASLPAVTVGVKPLVWKQEADNAWVAAHYAIHQYWPHNNGPFSVSGYLGGLGAMALGKHPTLDAAQAAAQADYEARIMAALEPVAAPDPAAIREAIWSAFIAGCGQGSDEATSFEWGSTAQQTRQQAFDDFMAEWNKDSAPLRALISKGAADDRA